MNLNERRLLSMPDRALVMFATTGSGRLSCEHERHTRRLVQPPDVEDDFQPIQDGGIASKLNGAPLRQFTYGNICNTRAMPCFWRSWRSGNPAV